ncbi:hypothetical protein JKF63_05972 [Porcisia hertigi]|uniref:Uncharacterized protein n=1 Tax=Porcisia hertigi TaxID=2761500 RepID=A0A836IBM8_9TRYP|nr:hypothetical protein JKF63_05972 [Porcisia hertigi]
MTTTTTTQHLPRPVACSHISRPRAPVPQRNPSALHGGPFPSIGSSQPPPVRRGRRVMPVARGPQPTSVEPTRLTNGKKIKAVETLHTQSEEAQRDHHAFTGPSKSALRQRRTQQVRQGRSTNEGEQIKTTVGNDDSWMKGLTYSTIIDSPKGSFKTIDCEGPYKRRPRTRRSNNHENREDANYSSASKWNSLLVALRNLFL